MQCQEYVVKEGDTLYSLARQNGTTVERILELNRDIEPTKLMVGSLLCIPLGGAIIQDLDEEMPDGVMPEVDDNLQTVYIIRNGDTLLSVAERFKISPEQLLYANPNVNPGYIAIGTELNIPDVDTALPGSVKYIVRGDEDLIDILRQFRIGYGRLKLFNPGVDLTKLSEGMVIFVPEVYGGNAGKCDAGSYAYTIKEGDTVSSVAAKFNMPEEEFKKYREGFRVGEVICLKLNNFDDRM